MLTKSDLQNIQSIVRSEVKQEVAEQLEEKLDEKLAGYATKEDIIAFKSEILGAINKKDENDAGHQMLHSNLGEDVPKLQQQVQHLFKTFEIVDPTEVAVSI